MPKVYRISIGIEKDSVTKSYSDIHSIDMPQDLYDNFKWDGLVRLDIVTGDTIAVLSDKLDMIQACHYGIKLAYETINNWDVIFSKEKKDRMNTFLKENVGAIQRISEDSKDHSNI